MLKELTKTNIQAIVDRFSIGRVQDFEVHELYGILTTNQGSFILLELGAADYLSETANKKPKLGVYETFEKWRPKTIKKIIKTIPQKLERLLLPDYQGELGEGSSYVHYQHVFYAVFRILRSQ